MSKALFVTGTGTDVGKTYVTALLVKKLQETGKTNAYYKAAMSGNEQGPDGALLPGDALGFPSPPTPCAPMCSGRPYRPIWRHGWKAARWTLPPCRPDFKRCVPTTIL